MKHLNNIKNIIRIDNKLNNFKVLLARTAPILLTSPIWLASVVAAYNPQLRNFLLIAGSSYAVLGVYLLLTNKVPHIIRQKGLKDTLNRLAQWQYRKEEQNIINKLNTSDSVELCVEVATFFTIHSRSIALWRSRNEVESIIREPTFYDIEDAVDISRRLNFKTKTLRQLLELKIKDIPKEVLKKEEKKAIHKL